MTGRMIGFGYHEPNYVTPSELAVAFGDGLFKTAVGVALGADVAHGHALDR
jgi:hypothetical protein